ncbi:malonyl-CoA decarboxylase domain-containing protein [Roseobacter ponti]|uniref:Malonyl-CoA decarboxylase n=1 Tax=Roseobacter ponti TaxID=1891787 RepID=A0A858SNZ8_9RHOB|nr:malonyl-CoA decarboxylase family protein [Roseobacter ponti]QJF50395.1 malonyl-CoA decarboxylase [Roseobacter ponti]
MTKLADLLSTLFDRRYGRSGVGDVSQGPIGDLTAELMGAKGEITGLTVARAILDRYAGFSDDEKLAFFRHLASDMTLDPGRVRAALDTYEAGETKASYAAVMMAAEPRRQELIRRLNQIPGATGALVKMRADLLRLGKHEDALMALDLDFRHLFASWFNRGFLVLRPVNWESPAHILDRIIAYEAVHAISSWADLRRRVEPRDRRCFAFFHPAMPDEPLIFVEVALTRGIPGSVQTLLAQDREVLSEEQADTAVFYSISNCQAGLASISFGNSLIKQVVADLSIEFPDLATFVTLSPIPGFARWTETLELPGPPEEDDVLRALAARYLVEAKRPDGQPLDPVARFHLGNGASVHQIHAGADTSPKGRAQSFGTMVNYLYDTSRVSQNHERFAASQDVAMSADVRNLASAAEKAIA